MAKQDIMIKLSYHGVVKKVKITNPEQKTVEDLKIVARMAFKIPKVDKDNNPLEIKLNRKSTGMELKEKAQNRSNVYLSEFEFENEEFVAVAVKPIAG